MTSNGAPIGIGLNLPTWPLRDGSYATWPQMRSLALAIEALGVDTLWVPDHLQRESPKRGTFGFWECWTILTAAAEATSRIEIGPFIACTGFRNPALLAKMAETLDEVSGGRVVLGLGSGVPARDPSWSAFGYDGSRHVAKYGEAVEIVTRLVQDGALTFEGEHYRVDGAVIEPRGPRAGAMPVFAAGVGDRTAQVAARHADRINVNKTIANAADAAEVMAIARRACEAVGRDPADARRHGLGPAVDRRRRGRGREAGLPGGEPAEVAATVRAIRDAGVEHLTMYAAAADDPSPLPALTDEYLDRFAPFLEAIRAA